MDYNAASSPTSFSTASSAPMSERERETSNGSSNIANNASGSSSTTSVASFHSPTSNSGFSSSKVGSITPTASPISSPWAGLPSARKALGAGSTGAIGSQRGRANQGQGQNVNNDGMSPAVSAGLPGGDWFPPLKTGVVTGGVESKGYPGLGRTDSMDSNSFASVGGHPGLQNRTVSSSVIGGERRYANASSNSSITSRPASPSVSITSPHPSTIASPASFFPPSSASAITGHPPPGFDSHNTPTPSVQQHQGNPVTGAGASAGASNNGSTPQELESAFDSMLRTSPAFQQLLNRVGSLESQVSQLLAHSLTTASTPGLNGPPFDATPTRSPSVASSSMAGSFLTAPTGGAGGAASRPHSLLLANNHSASPSIVSTALHSPSLSAAQDPATSSGFAQSANVPPPNASTTSVDREVIRHLTAQLSTLGNNVAHLMAQQQQHQGQAASMGPPGTANPGGSAPPSAVGNAPVGGWPFDGAHSGPHGHHGPPHPLVGRPNLSNLRASSYDIPRGAALPRGAAAAAAAGYGDDRNDVGRGKRSHMNLQAPTPLGMGSRRHSADIIEGMQHAAEGGNGSAGGPNAGGPGGLGSQSLLGKWEALGVSGELLRAIVKYGIGPPSKIQMKAIPCVLNTQDIVAQASSIQERIQCYVIPALQTVYTNMHSSALTSLSDSGELSSPPKGVQALILTATIDQAGQAHRMCLGLGQSLGISSSLIVGQGDVSSEIASLSANPPHILVGTPQKLLDLLAIRSVQVDNLSLLVIDEMDQLIARNLSEFVNNLARLLPPPISGNNSRDRSPGAGASQNGFKPFEQSTSTAKAHERQTAIFSCTVPQEVLNFASALQLREPVRVLVRRETAQNHSMESSNTGGAPPNIRGIKHFFLYLAMGSGTQTPSRGGPNGPGGRGELSAQAKEWKLEALADLCSDADFAQAVVYCSSIDAVEAVSYKLVSRGIDALALHGDMGANARHGILTKFRSGNRGGQGIKRVLVVYDALCRSLNDIHQVAMVVNYDLPRAVEDYVHRASCAIASGYGRHGTSVNIVSSSGDIEMLRAIESFYRLKINELPPSLQSIA